jgi:hypothetical protein
MLLPTGLRDVLAWQGRQWPAIRAATDCGVAPTSAGASSSLPSTATTRSSSTPSEVRPLDRSME